MSTWADRTEVLKPRDDRPSYRERDDRDRRGDDFLDRRRGPDRDRDRDRDPRDRDIHRDRDRDLRDGRDRDRRPPPPLFNHKANPIALSSIKQHRLKHAWTLWYTKPSEGTLARDMRSYSEQVKPLMTFRTVEEFWALYSHVIRPNKMQPSTDYHLFRDGIRPLWEDRENKKGGKVFFRTPKIHTNRTWENLMVATIGEQLEPAEEICGVVVGIKFGADDMFSVWNRSGDSMEIRKQLTDSVIDQLDLPSSVRVDYKEHDNSIKRAMKRPETGADTHDGERETDGRGAGEANGEHARERQHSHVASAPHRDGPPLRPPSQASGPHPGGRGDWDHRDRDRDRGEDGRHGERERDGSHRFPWGDRERSERDGGRERGDRGEHSHHRDRDDFRDSRDRDREFGGGGGGPWRPQRNGMGMDRDRDRERGIGDFRGSRDRDREMTRGGGGAGAGEPRDHRGGDRDRDRGEKERDREAHAGSGGGGIRDVPAWMQTGRPAQRAGTRVGHSTTSLGSSGAHGGGDKEKEKDGGKGQEDEDFW